MLNKYKHISFDMDGTLIHTVPQYRYQIVLRVVSELQGQIINQQHIDKFWFEINRNQTIQNHFSLEPKLFWELFRQYDTAEQRAKHTQAYADVARTLVKLKQQGKTVSIVTGAPNDVAKVELPYIDPASYDLFLSIHDSQYDEKPHPASMHFIMDKLNIKPEEIIYIGNGNEDAHYAANAGIDFIRIDRQEYTGDFGLEVKTIKSFDELFV